MPSIDLVIISSAKNDYFKGLTEQAIRTATENEKVFDVNVIVVEAQKIYYKNCVTIHQFGDFGYNRFMNMGASWGGGDFILFANNDLIFGEGWATALVNAMDEHKVNSACPYCPISHNITPKTLIKPNSGVYEGYSVRREFSGWAFCLRRKLWEQMPLPETVTFWASDNVVVEALMERGERHILVTDSIVTHIDNGSKTLFSVEQQERIGLMHQQIHLYNKLYSRNLFTPGVTVVIGIYGDLSYWLPLANKCLLSIKRQTIQPNYCYISIGKTLQDARNKQGLLNGTLYTIFVDADDELDEHYIENMLKYQSDITVPAVHRHYSDGRIDTDQFWFTPKPLLEGNYIVIGAMIKTELFKRLGGFADMPVLEDWQLFIRAEEAGAVFTQCPNAIYKVNVRENSRNNVELQSEWIPKIINEAKKRRGLV